ncbi:FGGY family carbohydrate kinase [Egicoccus sp. AB-alg6-2]|uniref:FGGY family carbohydrate kinase n=1 Tax=Egicoccus sp. AB-alg6-2 TaxID=3242692 RepID=UPI00359D36BA
MTDGFLLGIDIGTSSCKAVVLGADGAEYGGAERPTPWSTTSRSPTLDARDLLATTLETCAAAQYGIGGPIVGIGVASMAEAGFLLDVDGAALAPALTWGDARAAELVPSLAEDLPDFTAMTGLPVSAKPSLVKHRWLVDTDPALARSVGWSNVAEYVVHLLGGERVAEPSLASRTGWLDVERLDWWPDALAWSGVDATFLPPLRTAGSPLGVVDGIPGLEGAALTVAGHDHLCAAVGVGAVTADDVVDSCGSAEVLLRAVAPPLPRPRRRWAAALGFTTGRHVVAGQLALIGGFPSGARLRRLAALLGFADPRGADRNAWLGSPSAPPVDAERLDQWIDELTVTGPPPDAASAGQMWRAAVESIAAKAAERHATLIELTGPARRVITTGGSSRDALVAEARQRHLPGLEHRPVSQAAARGAALFAAVAAGVDVADAAALRPRGGSAGPEGRS